MNAGTIIAPPPHLQPRYRYKIHDKLYDLTDFVKVHPGGQDMFNNLKPDTNITPMIYAYHKNPRSCLAMLPKYEVPFTDDIIIQYDTNYTYDKYCELKKLVYDEIHEKKIPLHWSNKEITYNAFMLSMYLETWTYCFYNANNLSYWWMVLLAFMNTGICNLIFHDAAHYAGFTSTRLNNYFAMCYFPLMNTDYWKHVHNYLHHCFTNTEYDEDFNFERYGYIIRHSEKQPHMFIHRFQSIYSIAIYTVVLFNKCFIKIITQNKTNIISLLFIFYMLGIFNSCVFYGLSSFLFVFIAQLSHIQHECVQINTKMKNDFLNNQVSSSMNYRTDDLITRLLCYSLDIQIEHHLFPNIPHSSARQIQHIVRVYCEKNDIPYIEKPSIFPTIYSYICYLYKMGNP